MVRTIDHEAQLVAKNDAKFLAKLTKCKTPQQGQSRSGSPAALQQRPSQSACNSPSSRQTLKPNAGCAVLKSNIPAAAGLATAVSGLNRQCKQSLSLQHPAASAGHHVASSNPVSPGTAAADHSGPCTADTAPPDCLSTSSDGSQAPLPATQPTVCTAAVAVAAEQVMQQQQQQHVQSQDTQQQQQQLVQLQDTQQPPGCSGGQGWRCPNWLLHTVKARSAPAGARANLGPLHSESSLYAAWAGAQGAASSAAPPASAGAELLTRSLPASPVGAAPRAAAKCGDLQLPAAKCGGCDNAISSSVGVAGRSSSPLQQRALPVTGAYAATRTAFEAVAVLPGSPCSSNYDSARAAAIAAGVSRAGTVSPEHQDWFRQQLAGVQPPRREDTQQLWHWLAEELQQLQHQLLHPQNMQPQNAQDAHQLQHLAGVQVVHAGAQQSQHVGRLLTGTHTAVEPPPGPNRDKAASRHAMTAGISISRRSASPPGHRCQSPGRLQAGRLDIASMPLDRQAQQLTLLCRVSNGALDIDCLQKQQELYSSAFNELCRHVTTSCVEQGALMAQLWSAQAVLLHAALQDRQAALEQQAAAQEAVAAAARQQQQLQQHQEDERVALRAINERHAARANTAKQEYDKLKQQHDNLQELLKRLSGAQQLVERVMDLEAAARQQALQVQQLQGQLADKQVQLDATESQLSRWQDRAQIAEGTVQQQAQQLGCSTPRPKRDLGLLCDLVEPQQQQLIEQALIAGVPASHVHRLLLGLSTTGHDLRPWLALAGSCVPALQRASDPTQPYTLIRQHLVDCDAASLAKYLSSPEQLQLLGQAVHVSTDQETLLSLMTGSLGLPATMGTQATGQQQHSMQSLARTLAPATAAVGSIGAGLPLLPLVGVLASKYGHDARELGGPVTEALAHAQLSTVARVQEMESKSRGLHREVVMLKCTLAEQRKHEQEHVEAALRDQKRKITRRDARQYTPIEKFLQTKWGPVFSGIGLSEDIPRVMRANVPINNKQMPKREAEKLAAEIWAFKEEQDAAGGQSISLAEATAVFLERRFFAIPRLVSEVAYNMIYSLGQHMYDTDCNLFLRVFSGEVNESVKKEQQLLEGEIMRMLKLLDMSINHQATGWLHKADVKTALAGFFKSKKVDRLAEVLEALDTDESGDALHYSCLFSDDDQFNQGMTAEIIRSQHLAERLEFLQEVEDVIRDAAEDNGTTSLTPAMLASCLRKAHKSLDSTTVSDVVARVFGSDWQEQQYRLTQPLGAVIKAVRSGGTSSIARPAVGGSSVAGAVNRIVPVGKFKNKLVSALKVGFSRDTTGGGGTAAPRRLSRGHSAQPGAELLGAGHRVVPKSRRATQEAVSAAVAAVLSGDGSHPKPKMATQQATSKDVAPADAADTARSSSSSEQSDTSRAANAAGAADIATTDISQAAASGAAQATLAESEQQGVQSRQSAEGSCARQCQTAGPAVSVEQGSSSAFTAAATAAQDNSPELQLAAAAVTMPARPPAAAPCTAAGAAVVRSSTAARALTVDMLSAMEAVRQSWLKEEEDKLVALSSSGAAGTPATGALALTAVRFSTTPQPMPDFGASMFDQASFGEGAAAADFGTVSGGMYGTGSGSSRHYAVPAVPALRLSEVLQASTPAEVYHAPGMSVGSSSRTGGSSSAGTTFRSSMAGSVPCSVRGSSMSGGGASTCGSEAAATQASSSGRSLLQQRSIKPILSRLQSHQDRPAKHVQISMEDTVFAFRTSQLDEAVVSMADDLQPPALATDCASPAGGYFMPPWLPDEQQKPMQLQDKSVATTTSAESTMCGADLDSSDVSKAAVGAAGGLLHSSSSSRRAGPPCSPMHSFHTQLSSKQAQQEASVPAEAAGSSMSHKKRGSKSFKHAALLPQLLLTDADDACAAELATPARPDEHAEVCFTPQAPEEGGKRNAFLMRRINKGKSLKQLEEVMLAVAVGGLGLE